MSELSLASEFPAPTRDAWAALVDKVLKGADLDRTLVGRTYDGLRIEPLYPKADHPEPVRRAQAGAWQVAQRVDHPDGAAANALALADLEGGADALVLSFDVAPAARGFGLRATTVDELDRALSGVMLDLVGIRLEAGLRGREAAAIVVELATRRGHSLAEIDLHLGLDPIGALAARGRMSADWPVVGERLSAFLADMAGRGFAGTIAIADGRPYHEAGASEAQELAAALATAVAYLRAFEAGGHHLEVARRAISFLMVADADEFLSVAKLRALRRLWARVEEACGLEPAPIRLHAETAWRMTTRRDPWVNLLRGTMATFSAGIGGADSVTVLPFTTALGLPDAFARRLARNTQTILIEEANLWRVADPVAGAGGFEALTDALAAEAWMRFQEIEREGGIVESLLSGALQRRIAETRARREEAVATRRDPITGTSEFPNIHEAPVAVLMPAAADTADEPNALPSRRDAEAFEALRDRSDDLLATQGTRPRVFLANLGPLAAFSARAMFARNLFEAGGIEAVGNDGFAAADRTTDIQALTDAFGQSGAALACICGSDEAYRREAAEVARALSAGGATSICLAGRPGDLEAELRSAGVTDFVHVGCDVLALLRNASQIAA